jgi:hypothetical protein
MDSVESNVENDDDWQGDMDVNPKEEVCDEGDKRKKQRGIKINYQYSKSFDQGSSPYVFKF